jgi:hypothetical protein
MFFRRFVSVCSLAASIGSKSRLRVEVDCVDRSKMPMKYCLLVALLVVIALSIAGPVPARAGEQIQVFYIPTGDETLTQLLEGAAGEGWLVYYQAQGATRRPLLAVQLSKTASLAPTVARVYQRAGGLYGLDVVSLEGLKRLSATGFPAVVMTATDGWWVRDGLPNYNLEIQVNGPMYALWGAGEDLGAGSPGWRSEVAFGQPAVNIQVRDTDGDGLPDWELRRLLPEFHGRGYIRVSYAESMCSTPVLIDHGVFPDWPFVALEGGFEQLPGLFHPPIVVDWEQGVITHFSELVTVRNQNCAYAFYSLDPLQGGVVNQPNFETPFAFYDLSGEGVGYPNLILRTEHYPAGDRWFQRSVHDFQTIRYSWRADVGDWLWDYKVEVAGAHPYHDVTSIAGGQYWIDAPPYEAFPAWVIDHAWPMVTFVDTEASSYRSSEGIYEWSPRLLGDPYFRGETQVYDLEGFETILEGLRGEYRVGREQPPLLYFSPLDNRLHLSGAEAGLWNLGEGLQMRLQNLAGGQHLDTWILEQVLTPEDDEHSALAPEPTIALERLHHLGEWLLYAKLEHIAVAAYAGPAAAFEIAPPVDQESWQAFRQQLAPLEATRRDPLEMSGWLDAVSETRFTLDGVQIRDLRAAGEVFRFVLEISPAATLMGDDLWGLGGLAPGAYLLELSGRSASVQPLVPAAPQIRLAYQSDPQAPSAVWVELGNTGGADLLAARLQLRLQCPGQLAELADEALELLAGGQQQHIFSLPPQLAAGCRALAWLEVENGLQLAIEELPLPAQGNDTAQSAAAWLASSAGGARLPVVLLLIVAVLLGVGLGWGIGRREGLR